MFHIHKSSFHMRVDPDLMYFSLSQTFCRSTLNPRVLKEENAKKS